MPVLQMFFFGPGRVMLSPEAEAKIQSRKEFGLLAYLAVEHRRAHSRESILGLFWPELGEDQARNNMRVALARLRKAIDHTNNPLILSDRRTIQFDGEAFEPDGSAWLDVAEIARLLARVESHAHVVSTQCPACLADMTTATKLYQGEFLSGFSIDGCEAFDHWLLIERQRFHRQITELLPQLESAHIANQEWNLAEQAVRRRLSLDPIDEDAHRTLMQILAFSGLRNAAIAHYDICVRTLDDELSVPPSEETVALAEMIREGNLVTPLPSQLVTPSPSQLVTPLPSQLVTPSFNPYAILNRLEPLPDQTLFGVENALATVGGAIYATDRSWLIAVEGIGGLGKTTLANALVKEIIEASAEAEANLEGNTAAEIVEAKAAYQDIAWASAKQQEYLPDRGVQSTGKPALDEESLMDQLLAQLSDGPYPTGSSQEKRLALTRLLKEKRCLVVVDNLETSIDYQALMPLMRHLANPSKFLITSRVSLSGQGDVFCYSLSELSKTDALSFLRHEAKTRGMGTLADATTEQLQSIYETVGGNPLALKLVLGQLQFLPLTQILVSLRHADTDRTEQLYSYIYWQAWEMLDGTSRHLLLCLPVIPNATFAQLQNVSTLDADSLRSALMNLRNLSLIEMGGDFNESRYRLHRLTETFLMHEVVKWQDSSQPFSSAETEYFVQRILYMVEQWNESEAVQGIDVTILDYEFESVVKAISLGLELEQGWATVKPLIIAFTPFMERRGHWHTWHSILERAIETAHRAADVDGEITLTALLARLCQRESRPNDVAYYYRRVIRMARRSGNRFEEARACSNLGFAYIEDGHWWRSEALSCHALKVFDELESAHGRAHTHNHLGVLYTRQERWGSAEKNLMTACEIWEEMQDNHSLINGYMNLGLMFVEMQKSKPALEHLVKASRVSELTGELSSTARIWNNMAAAHRINLDWVSANKYAKKAESYFRKTTDFSGLANVWHNLGLIANDEGNYEMACNYLEESLSTYQQLNYQAVSNIVRRDLKVAYSMAN